MFLHAAKEQTWLIDVRVDAFYTDNNDTNLIDKLQLQPIEA